MHFWPVKRLKGLRIRSQSAHPYIRALQSAAPPPPRARQPALSPPRQAADTWLRHPRPRRHRFPLCARSAPAHTRRSTSSLASPLVPHHLTVLVLSAPYTIADSSAASSASTTSSFSSSYSSAAATAASHEAGFRLRRQAPIGRSRQETDGARPGHGVALQAIPKAPHGRACQIPLASSLLLNTRSPCTYTPLNMREVKLIRKRLYDPNLRLPLLSASITIQVLKRRRGWRHPYVTAGASAIRHPSNQETRVGNACA